MRTYCKALVEFPKHVCFREGNTVPLKQPEEGKTQTMFSFPLCLPVLSLCGIFFYLRVICFKCQAKLPLILPTESPLSV